MGPDFNGTVALHIAQEQTWNSIRTIVGWKDYKVRQQPAYHIGDIQAINAGPSHVHLNVQYKKVY